MVIFFNDTRWPHINNNNNNNLKIKGNEQGSTRTLQTDQGQGSPTRSNCSKDLDFTTHFDAHTWQCQAKQTMTPCCDAEWEMMSSLWEKEKKTKKKTETLTSLSLFTLNTASWRYCDVVVSLSGHALCRPASEVEITLNIYAVLVETSVRTIVGLSYNKWGILQR